jgi:hypothetical protein
MQISKSKQKKSQSCVPLNIVFECAASYYYKVATASFRGGGHEREISNAGSKNWFLPKEMNANRFFWDSHWLEIWSNHFYPSMGPNGGSVAMDSAVIPARTHAVTKNVSYIDF